MSGGCISVIIAAYNAEATLERCVATVLAQDYANVEVIIVDDGSADGTPALCDRLAFADARCRVLHQENRGLSGARNAGLDASTGEYVFFLDADDYLAVGELSSLLSVLLACNADMAVGGLTKVDKDGAVLSVERLTQHVVTEEGYWDGYYASSERWSVDYIVSCGKLFKAYLFATERFDLEKLHEDEFIIHRIVAQCERIAMVPAVGYYYVQNDASIMHTRGLRSYIDTLDARLSRAEYFYRRGMSRCAWHALVTIEDSFEEAGHNLGKAPEMRRPLRRWRALFLKLLRSPKLTLVHMAGCASFFISPRLYAHLKRVKSGLRLRRRLSCMGMLARLALHQLRYWRSVILIATPTHGNLGDQAIVLAERHLLADMGFEGSLFEVERAQYELAAGLIERLVRPCDLIVIDGGGNVGTLWPEENDKMNDIVARFSHNVVVIFPQTAFFEDSAAGGECQTRVEAAYAKNPRLVFFSRDEPTYRLMQHVAPTVCNHYVPDVVLSLGGESVVRPGERHGALLCLRDDKERLVDEGCAGELKATLVARGLDVAEASTVVREPARISRRNRGDVLRAKLDEFRSAEVVVTDRLHGMLFAAITGTPCVALDNVSHKVSNGHVWVAKAGVHNVKVARAVEEVPALLDEVIAEGPACYDPAALDVEFGEIREAIADALL